MVDLRDSAQKGIFSSMLWAMSIFSVFLAGIITQLLVENELSEKGVQKEDIGRENFISKVWEWKEKSGENISTQMRKL